MTAGLGFSSVGPTGRVPSGGSCWALVYASVQGEQRLGWDLRQGEGAKVQPHPARRPGSPCSPGAQQSSGPRASVLALTKTFHRET